MAKTREARILLSRRKKKEERRKNRHGIVVEEMALRPLNSRLLSSQPRNSAFPAQFTHYRTSALKFLSSSPPPLIHPVCWIASSRRPLHCFFLEISDEISSNLSWSTVYGASRGMHESRSFFSWINYASPIRLLVIFTVIKYLFHWNKRWMRSLDDDSWTKGKRRIFECWTLKEFDGKLKKNLSPRSKIGSIWAWVGIKFQKNTGFGIYCCCHTKRIMF